MMKELSSMTEIKSPENNFSPEKSRYNDSERPTENSFQPKSFETADISEYYRDSVRSESSDLQPRGGDVTQLNRKIRNSEQSELFDVSLDSDKKIDINQKQDIMVSNKYDVDIHENIENKENDYLSTYKERLNQTPRDDGERGEWIGERGESKYIPNDKVIVEILSQQNMDGIEYKNAIPDFSELSKCTVEIDNMTEMRRSYKEVIGNFEQCDKKCAELWNSSCQDGKNDWTARDVERWRETNGYSWHERNDMKTCDLILTKINDYFGHLGGVGECRRRDLQIDFGGEFDE